MKYLLLHLNRWLFAACVLLSAAQVAAQAPAAATGVTVQALGPRKMLVTWTDNATDETGYVVERALSSGAAVWVPGTFLPAGTSSYEDSQGLQGSTGYYYRVKAVSGSGESLSNEAFGTTPDYPTSNHSPDGIGLYTFNLGLNFSAAISDPVTHFEEVDVDAAKDGDLAASAAGAFWFKRHTPVSPAGAVPLDEVDVYLKDGSGNWVYQTTLQPPVNAGSSTGFGTCVAAQGSRIFIGAPGALNSANAACGKVYVYELNGTTLTLQQELEPSAGAAGDEFGFAIAVDGEKLVIGAPGRDKVDGATTIADAGAAFLYEHTTTWQPLRTEWGQTVEAGCKFGFSVSLKDRIVAMGAPYEDVIFNVNGGTYPLADSGSAYVGLWSRPNELARYPNLYWFFPPVQAKIEGLAGSHFGWSVAVGDMMRIAVGMPDSSWVAADNMTGWDAGLVMIFHWHGQIDPVKQFIVDAFSHEDLSIGNRFGEYVETAGGGMDFGTQTALRINNAPVHYYSMESLLVQPGTVVNGQEQPWTVGDLFSIDPDDDPLTYQPPTIGDAPGDHFEIVGTQSFATRSSLSEVINGLHPVWFHVSDDRGGWLTVKTTLEISGGAADIDGDGIPDWWEMQHFGSLDNSDIADFDGDGYSNLEEYVNGTDPSVWTGEDTDGDGVPDTLEVVVGTNPQWKDNPLVELSAEALAIASF